MFTTRPFLRACAVSVLLAAFAGSASAEGTWTRLRSAHFSDVLTDAPPDAAADVIRRLESMRGAIGLALPGVRLDAPVPLFVVLFRDGNAMAPFARSRTTGDARLTGSFSGTAGVQFLAANIGDEDGVRSACHEYVHHVLALTYGKLPLWLEEGLAEYFSTFAIEGGEAKFGLPIDNHVAWLDLHPVLPLRSLTAVDVDSERYRDVERSAAFYAQSWATVHFLLHGAQPDRRAALGRYLDVVGAGRPFGEAFVAVFGSFYESLDAEFERYVRRPEWAHASSRLERAPVTAEVTRGAVADADVDAVLGWLLLTVGDDKVDAAAAMLGRTLAARPRDAMALAGMGEVHSERGRVDDAKAAYEQALAADPLQHLAAYRLAEMIEGGPSPNRPRVRALLAAALSRWADFPEALSLLGETYTAAPMDPARGIPVLERARAWLPASTAVASNLVRLYRVAREKDKAADAFRTLCWLDPLRCAELQDDETALGRIAHVNDLVKAGRTSEACALGREILREVYHPDLRRDLESWVRDCEETLSENACIERYNEAVGLANAGRTRDALAVLNDTLPACKGRDVSREMIRVQTMLRRRLAEK